MIGASSLCGFAVARVGFASFIWNYSIWLGGKCMNIDDVFVVESHRGLHIGEHV